MPTPRRLAAIALILVPAFAWSQSADDIHAVCKAALESGRFVKGKGVGFGIYSKDFAEAHQDGGILVGLDVSLRERTDNEVAGVQAVYKTPAGVVKTTPYGAFKANGKALTVVRLRAPEGYAVGALNVRTSLGIRGIRLLCMARAGSRLDTKNVVYSRWAGASGGGEEAVLGGDGNPLVGIHGGMDDRHAIFLGVFQAKTAAAVAPEKTKSPVKTRPADKDAPPPVVAVGGPEKQPVVADKPKEKPKVAGNVPPEIAPDELPPTKYRDAKLHFEFELPAGWKEMTAQELFEINEAMAKDGSSTRYVTGFRPGGSKPRTLPLIVLQTTDSAGMTYDEIEAKVLGPMRGKVKTVRNGAFGDISRTVTVGSAVLDRHRNRIIARTAIHLPATWQLKALDIETFNVFHLGRTSVASLHCYSEASRFDKELPRYTLLNNSFGYDKGHAYERDAEAESKAKMESSGVLPFLVFVGVAGVIAIPVGLYWMANRGEEDRLDDQPVETMRVRAEGDEPRPRRSRKDKAEKIDLSKWADRE